MNKHLHKLDINSNPKKLNYRDLVIFIVPMLIFSFYLYIYNPGILSTESFSQLHQIATGEFNNGQPFFHTFIEMICLKIFGSTLSIAFLQIFVFSAIWTVICKYHRDDSPENINQYLLQFILTLIICLIPINAVYSITLWQEILFSYSLLFLCFLIKVMIDKSGQIDLKFAIIMALTMGIASQLSSNGLLIVIITLVIVAAYLFMKNKTDKMFLIVPAATVVIILLIASLSMAYNVEDVQKEQTFINTAHMLADYDLNLNLNDADKTKINELMNESQIKSNFKPSYRGSISPIAHNEVFDKDSDAYINMARGYSMSNPFEFLKYSLKSSAIVWDITRNPEWIGEVYYLYEDGAHLENARDKYFTSIGKTPTESYEKLSSANLGNWKYYTINSYVTAFKDNAILDTLFNSPALYMYLAIILLVVIHFITKSKEMYLVYVPNLLNIIGVFMTTPIQENRLLYANLLVFYLLIIIFMSIWFKSDRKALPVTLNIKTKKTRENNKDTKENVLENEYDVSDSDIDSIINDKTLEETNSQSEETTPKEQPQETIEIEESLYAEKPQKPDETNISLEESANEEPPQETINIDEIDSDLLNEILKEIEMEKNKD